MFESIIKSEKRKKIISIIILVALIGSMIGIDLFVDRGNSHKIYASEYRDGYMLTPTHIDATGLYTDSKFIISAKENDLTSNDIKDKFIIPSDREFNVELVDNEFIISLTEALDNNKVYTFSYEGASWTYQTRSDFEILGVLPANESTYVPVNTGIELYFSHEGANIEDYLEISPKVDGRFESHGKVMVFVPDELEKETVYTVTVKAGLTLEDSQQTLAEDYSFQFETAADEDGSVNYGYFDFESKLYEFISTEKPMIQFTMYGNGNSEDITVDTNIYQYDDKEAFVDDLENLIERPTWTRYASDDSIIDTKELDSIISFEQEVNLMDYGHKYLEVPVVLEPGYYLVDARWNEINKQVLIQVADFSYSLVQTETEDVVWVNDLSTKEPVQGATIFKDNELMGTTDSDGLALFNMLDSEGEYGLYEISYNNMSLYNIVYSPYAYSDNEYWSYIETDRNLYKPDDEIFVWGFIRDRLGEESIENVTVEITSNNWWWYYDLLPFTMDEMAYETVELEVEDGFYSGSIVIPNLSPDSYELSVKVGEKRVATQYIQVENYVKPDYKIEVTKDQEAIFLGEDITFTVNTSFYEGTPVSNIPIDINIGSLDYVQENVVSDINGEYIITYTPVTKPSHYTEEVYGYFSASASLPESGEIYSYNNFRVFINDVHMELDTELKDEKGSIKIQLNDITLDRINGIDSEDDDSLGETSNYVNSYDDILGTPVANQEVTGKIYKNVWIKTEIGSEYDFINKAVKKKYRYDLETTQFDSFNVITDGNGAANYELELPELESGYYTIYTSTLDKSDRTVKVESGFYRDYEYYPNDYESYTLETDKEEYKIGEEMSIAFISNKEADLDGYFLFLTSQNGLLEAKVSESAEIKKNFDETFMPNVYVNAVWFDGNRLQTANSAYVPFDYDVNNLVIEASTNQEAYMPGDECIIDIKAKYFDEALDEYVAVKDAVVNISVVDESIFSLSEYNVEVLDQLYSSVSDGVYRVYNSHTGSGSMGYGMRYDSDMMEMAFDESMELAGGYLAKAQPTSNDGAAIRSEFKDTSEFKTIYLDESGSGSHSFILPDNITSWRMVLSGISKDLKAGGNTSDIIVTLPYFINTNMNKTYLVGDKPSIGISSYGASLREGEAISYKIYCEETGFETIAYGEAFERVNIPLWTLEEGSYKVIVEGYTESGYSDGIEMVINVIDSYHQIEVADHYEASKGLTIDGPDDGMIDIMFMDGGKGKFIKNLYTLVYRGGKRVDQRYVAYIAKTILEEEFSVDVYKDDEVDLFDYQQDNGLLSILPYAEGDIETTIKMLPIIKDRVNTAKIRLTLESLLYSDDYENMSMVLYGLTVLDEPVLLEIDRLNSIENLSFKDKIYLALCYANLGDEYSANKIFEEAISPYITDYEEISVVEYGKTSDDYLYYTSLVGLLASKLDLDNKDNLFAYMTDNIYSKELLINPEMLTFIEEEIGRLASSDEVNVSYQYNGSLYEEEIINGWSQSITIPASKLDSFIIDEVKGNVEIVTTSLKPIKEGISIDEDISLNKQITSYNGGGELLKEGDIVKITIDYDIADTAIDDVYTITDYAPSGLVPLENNYIYSGDGYYYHDVDGQKVTFYVHKNNKNKTCYYYARIVSLGEYQAEEAIMQGTKVKDSINFSNPLDITIE